MSIPIIYYYKGNPEFLKASLVQCKKFNHTVYLLGDNTNRNIVQEIQWFSAEEFSDTARWKHFEDHYVAMSTNDFTFELNCFKRFFVIDAFIERMKIDRFVYLDGDILCYIDFSSEPVFYKYDVGMCVPEIQDNYKWSANCGISFWTAKSLKAFLDFCIDTYEKNTELLKEKWNYHCMHHLPGGVCDMTLEYLWYESDRSFNKYNLSKRTNELNGIMDININSGTNYKNNEYKIRKIFGIKSIVFDNGCPYFVNISNERVRVYGIHFLGSAKKYLLSYAEKQCISPWFYFKVTVKRIFRYIKKVIH